MTEEDYFARKHREDEAKRIREQSKAHEDALQEELQRRLAAKKTPLDPNRDIGYKMSKKFFEFGL